MTINRKKNFLTTCEAAAQLGFHPDYLRRLILRGEVKAEKLGRNWLINVGDLAKVQRKRFPRMEKQDHGSIK